jgi:hypothetical protein
MDANQKKNGNSLEFMPLGKNSTYIVYASVSSASICVNPQLNS